MKAFDRKFGKEFLSSVPTCPAVYYFRDEEGRPIYVGKAKNLRRRLSQYRNATRLKKHRKMRKIVDDGVRITWELCASDFEACLKEIKEIQALRPRRNVAGAFSYRYPMIGLREEDGHLLFCMTTLPEQYPGFVFHGAFRSREITGKAFFSLMQVLEYAGHPKPRKEMMGNLRRDYSYVFGFRRLPAEWTELWHRFFRGESSDALEALFFRLLDNAGARAKAREIQEAIDTLRQFWECESSALHAAIKATGYASYPVLQAERDPLFLRYRMELK